ncbi:MULTISPECIES: metallophosphoesterase [unclassified Azospirillum]|uniref:metallophosphoesterase family protein n=1 Tax=unclassified Azospirillum TaxID=2630922 RepID=UPI000B6C549A|nr:MULTISPECIES: metallophosphoesterase [unclassified Azospirillum]SNS98061.1 Calcineurin-like phosphoesterase [Azospirillum sp. RU38E]SNT14477.1 Calcineurin-like phosphoesterase [Azospirillum sp. RU37A]
MRPSLFLAPLLSLILTPAAGATDFKLAFMPDVHFHDVYGQFGDNAFPGVPDPAGGPPATIRTMAAQLTSTRLFNENYFAFRAALDDAARRGVKLVVMNGDFSDDGQPVHLRGLKRILDEYETRHGMRFFLTNGNHDPVKPGDTPSGKADFLGRDGRPQPIFSPGTAECPQDGAPKPGTICTPDIAAMGYQGILDLFARDGFAPRADDLYWETPFYRPQGGFDAAAAAPHAAPAQRQYQVCAQEKTDCRPVIDSSYLVEPVAGLWLLAIDANVYRPTQGGGFKGSGDAGWNEIASWKPHLLAWVADVAKRAQQQGKVLVTFSHYPAVDTNNGTTPEIAALFGAKKLDLHRMPTADTSRRLAEAGIRFTVGGHLHFNDTAEWRGADGRYLVNIQPPPPAAYIPAYKLMTVNGERVEVETPRLDKVPDFNRLFGFYRMEWQRLKDDGAADIWNPAILESRDYRQFTDWHLRELVRLRFLPRDWPADLRDLLLAQDAAGLGALAGVTLTGGWQGLDLAVDFHRLLNDGDLALADIPKARRADYQKLQQALAARKAGPETPEGRLARLLAVMQKLADGPPSDHFRFDLKSGTLTNLAGKP